MQGFSFAVNLSRKQLIDETIDINVVQVKEEGNRNRENISFVIQHTVHNNEV